MTIYIFFWFLHSLQYSVFSLDDVSVQHVHSSSLDLFLWNMLNSRIIGTLCERVTFWINNKRSGWCYLQVFSSWQTAPHFCLNHLFILYIFTSYCIFFCISLTCVDFMCVYACRTPEKQEMIQSWCLRAMFKIINVLGMVISVCLF